MQMNHICLIELGECGNVCTRVGNVDSKKIMFFKSVCFPDDDALPDELPYFPPRFFIPLFFRASIRRWAAMAAPPIRSDVLMISTLMCINVYAKVRFLEEMFGIFLPFYAPKSPFKVRLIRRMALAINELVRA